MYTDLGEDLDPLTNETPHGTLGPKKFQGLTKVICRFTQLVT